MNQYVERIFKHRKPDFGKLKAYGFAADGETYRYATEIKNGQFRLNLIVSPTDVAAELIDVAAEEPFTLFLVEEAAGSFLGEVRTAYENALTDVAKLCFEKCTFKSADAQAVIAYVRKTYGDELEFLWEKFDDNAIWRRKDNKKWYGALLTVSKKKLGLPSDDRAEILDLRGNAEALVDGVRIFGGYHMNKKSWITVCLDGSLPINEIFRLIDESYNLAKK